MGWGWFGVRVEPAAGLLLVVGTPIGNLADLSPRAARALATADAVICEDSRRTGRLLAQVVAEFVDGVDGKDELTRPELLVANEHTEYARIPEIIDRLNGGQTLALVSDAGMPVVSDPGAAVVAAVRRAGHRVVVVPGPSAVSAALALSGLSADRYVFEGFLPRKGRERRQRLDRLAEEVRTVVLYEAPHRLTRTLQDLAGVCGPDRSVVVAREMTKLYEESELTTLARAAAWYAKVEPRGEFVLVVAGADDASAPVDDDELRRRLSDLLSEGRSKRDAVAAVVADTGAAKRRVYDLANALA